LNRLLLWQNTPAGGGSGLPGVQVIEPQVLVPIAI